MKSSSHYVVTVILTFLAIFNIGIFAAFAQSYKIQGKVIDADSKSPLSGSAAVIYCVI